jgi:regulator of protease activity HflC (stomatin/prohibitin superfamily)
MDLLDGFALDGLSITLIGLGILALLVLFAGAKTVPQGYHYTVERFGRYTRTLRPGLNLIIPFIDGIGKRLNVMEQVLDVPHQEVITRDNATVTANGVTFFQILDAAAAAYEVSNLENAILNLTMTNIRSVMGSMDLDELLSHRDEINERVLRVVDTAVSPWGVKITRIEIKDIDPPKDLVESMGRQMKAEREKRAAILEAEGRRQSAILQAEGAKQAQVLEAEGRREAAFRDAEARERSAEAEAKATQVVSDAIASGSVQAINYFVANNYIEALGKLASAPNQKVLMLPVEASSVIGSIGGIAEIARETFGAGAAAPVRSTARPPSSGSVTES